KLFSKELDSFGWFLLKGRSHVSKNPQSLFYEKTTKTQHKSSFDPERVLRASASGSVRHSVRIGAAQHQSANSGAAQSDSEGREDCDLCASQRCLCGKGCHQRHSQGVFDAFQ